MSNQSSIEGPSTNWNADYVASREDYLRRYRSQSAANIAAARDRMARSLAMYPQSASASGAVAALADLLDQRTRGTK